jgi:hypothetical protein
MFIQGSPKRMISHLDSQGGNVALTPRTFPNGILSTAMKHMESRENVKKDPGITKDKN